MKNIELIGAEIIPAVEKHTMRKAVHSDEDYRTVGATTRTVMNYEVNAARHEDAGIEAQLVDLSEHILRFSDGRDFI